MKLRLRLAILTANEPFLFYTGVGKDYYTGTMAWSLKGFIKALKEVNVKAIEFHVGNGDFESWAKSSLKDKKLASKIKEFKASKETGEKLRKAIVDVSNKSVTLPKARSCRMQPNFSKTGLVCVY